MFSDEVACVDPDICYTVCQSYAGCTNIAYPRLVLGIMPEGLFVLYFYFILFINIFEIMCWLFALIIP